MAKQRFFLLPLVGATKNRRNLEDLFDVLDKKMILNQLGIRQATNFKKVIPDLYYAPNREDILAKISRATIDNFDAVFAMMNVL